MLLTGTAALEDAHRHGRALGAFTVYNVELAQAVITAAQAVGVPVLIQAGSSGFQYAGEDVLGQVAMTMARQSPSPVGVHLDHSRSLEEVRRCLDRGYTSVMVDGSHLPFAENVRMARDAAAIAEPYGAWVEAELGVIAGDEDRSTSASAAAGTDPRQAGRFADDTGVHALAVAVGNVHGMTPEPVSLDLDRLREIGEHTTIPLVLHGASGLPDHELAAAIDLGVAKVNVNAEVRRAYIRALTGSDATSDNLTAFSSSGIAAAAALVTAKLRLFTRHDTESESDLP
jgi:tagatose 1,6-diphosphate aldolase GatY/KbaY